MVILPFKFISEVEELADKVKLGLELNFEAVACLGEDMDFAWASHLDRLGNEVVWEWTATNQCCRAPRIPFSIH